MENFIGFLGIVLVVLMAVALFRKRSHKDLKPDYLEKLDQYQRLYRKLLIGMPERKMDLAAAVQLRELRSSVARHLIPEDSELASDAEAGHKLEDLLRTMEDVQLRLGRLSRETDGAEA
ncbi:MAG TPA: hypothetical protein VMC79_06340 [Rectinemataceae bacterium]|nr:hypothetical protein [Rectinemataceae bacterium]